MIDLDKEAQVNARNVNGCTPLHIAVMIQNANLVKLLIKFGADVNIKVNNTQLRNITTLERRHLYTTVYRRITIKLPIFYSIVGPILLWGISVDLLPCTMQLVKVLNKL
jgi:ankyrin repeat protein